jgi:hypothetical protein
VDEHEWQMVERGIPRVKLLSEVVEGRDAMAITANWKHFEWIVPHFLRPDILSLIEWPTSAKIGSLNRKV